jgi:hypothetical protein
MSPTRPLDARRIFEHDSDHGFCTVCGAVWPCSRARRQHAAQTDDWLLSRLARSAIAY